MLQKVGGLLPPHPYLEKYGEMVRSEKYRFRGRYLTSNREAVLNKNVPFDKTRFSTPQPFRLMHD